jgi:sulfatase maturation enzyme AslB (radical SAM superfamily)
MDENFKKTGCPLAWNHFSVSLDTSMRICCNTHNGGRILNEKMERIPLSSLTTLDDYYNNSFYKELRLKMLNGERHQHCLNCFSVEDNGGQSLRQIYLNKYASDEKFRLQLSQTRSDGGIEPQVTFMDFSLGNKCNLKCIMCNPHASSNLKNDFNQLGWSFDEIFYQNTEEGWIDEDELLQKIKLCLPTVSEMLFTGGEPLISNLHFKILNSIISLGKSKDIVLRYHSNFTFLPQRLLDIWTEFRSVELHASIDGVGELNDYIRFGSDFKTIEQNIIRAANLSNIHVEVHTCFEITSILGLPDLYAWLSELHPRISPMPYHIWVSQPQWLDVSHLPLEVKAIARKRIENSLEKSINIADESKVNWIQEKTNQVMALLNRMDINRQDENLWHEFKSRISSLESLRGNNLKKITPELFR